MDKFPKLFIKAGLAYLLLGVTAGTLMALGLLDSATFRFVHLHLNLLGFMCMTIFGVAYHILPRFNGRHLPHPALVPVQFFLMNAGLIGMLALFIAGGYWESGAKSVLFGLFSVATAASVVLFALNIFPILVDPPPVVLPSVPKVVEDKITGDIKVSAVLETYPDIIRVFTEHGFKSLANPVARAAFAKMITISGACRVHHADETKLLAALNDFVKGSGKAPSGPAKKAESAPAGPESKTTEPYPAPASGKGITKGEMCAEDVLVGKLIETYPETKKVFEKNYGAACFSCPGQAFETIEQTASMHNADIKLILGEINAEIEKALQNKSA